MTHLLFNNVGSHGDREPEARETFRARLARVRPAATEFGLPLIDVDTNVHEHFDIFPQYTNVAFGNTHTLRNAAVPHVLGAGVGHWYYAASQHLSAVQTLRPTAYIDSVDPLLLPLLSTGQLTLLLANMDDTRVSKTKRISDWAFAQQHLDVCVTPELASDRLNCSRCNKCMRTQMTLDMIGRLEKFEKIFDLDVYAARKDDYAVEILASSTHLAAEIRNLARETGWVWPIRARRRAWILRQNERARYVAHSMKERLPS